ncbi:hypothetical protein KC340_g8027 [Hortaea werneckii]|nr:hypothetical protein KC342_g8407 [Hortaea werneckii]KAI7096364.1 hypothetical protein KC339_g10424 [Hortaea werneckii]KAI7235808.1 hypothetical protein KC365_g5423 [Hortaea werneckii]KAI7318755.1 hypothetical protein KC340_g8027 [Hortaea werneckii]KAI7381422.1 hypothetical protein KC328_g12244 [Hortaea werneckii]
MKRLIVACDGTWTDSDNGFKRDSWLPRKTSGRLTTPSNVTRICRALQPRDEYGTSQVVYYQAGVGSEDNWYSFFIGGFLGEGISENIREAYSFLCTNYEKGDEIYLIGFSRGAFTARSVGGLIDAIGLLTRKGLDSFYPIFKDWELQLDPDYRPQYGSDAWPIDRPRFSANDYVPKLKEAELTRTDIPIKAIAVFDTVGTLGVPELTIGPLKLFSSTRKEYSFVNTEVPSNLEYAYHALALDEARKAFSPTIWESPKDTPQMNLKVLKQCWFPGVHSNVGGGYQDMSIADITLAWMMTQLGRHLAFDEEYLLRQRELNESFYTKKGFPVQSWAMGQIKRSDAGPLNSVTGRQTRTPGEYYATDAQTGLQTSRPLTNTCEFMHPSVRYRKDNGGLGLATSDKDPGHGTYLPASLNGWVYIRSGELLPSKAVDSKTDSEWEDRGRWFRETTGTIIVEDRMVDGSEEIKLLESWPGVAETLVT